MKNRFKCPNCTRELDERAATGDACPFCYVSFGPVSNSSATAIPAEYFSRGSSLEMPAVPEQPTSAATMIPEEMLTRGSAVEEGSARANSAMNPIPDKLIERRGALAWANAQPIAAEPEKARRAPSRTPLHHLKPRVERKSGRLWILGLVLTAIAGALVTFYLLSR